MLVLGPEQLLLHIAAAPVNSIAQGSARELCWQPAHDYRSRLPLIKKNQGFHSIKSNNHDTIDMTNKKSNLEHVFILFYRMTFGFILELPLQKGQASDYWK